jgi:hypothetical protein
MEDIVLAYLEQSVAAQPIIYPESDLLQQESMEVVQ